MKDLDKIFFRLSWWQYLRWQDDTTKATVLTLFFNHCTGIRQFDIERCTSHGTPSLAEQLVMPMIMQYETDKSAYIAKCETNSRNAKRNKDAQSNLPIPQATANDSQATACEHILSQGETFLSHTKGKERNRKERNCFVFSHAQACEGDQNKTKQNNLTKEDIIFLSALYYLGNGHTRPMAEAMSAYDFNEQSNWTEHKANGRDIDRSGDKLTWMRGWRCNKGGTISPAQGKCFADAARILDWRDPAVLDHYAGMTEGESVVTFLFDTKDAVKTFLSTLNSDQSKVDAFYDSLEANGITLAGKTVRVEYRR